MSHHRKDTFVPCGEWKQHLKPEGKRGQAQAERRYAKHQIEQDVAEFYQEVDDILYELMFRDSWPT